jgi:hypothetical protein
MRTPRTIVLLMLILFSCRGKQNLRDYYTVREDSVIYQLVDSLIGPDSTWRKFLLIRPPLFPEGYSQLELKTHRDSLLQRWDTAQLYMAFDDTMILFSRSYHSEHLKHTRAYFRNNLENIDTSYFPLFDKLVSDTLMMERRIDIKSFRSKYNYRIIQSDSIEAIRKRGFRIVELHKISRIIFNSNYDKACFYEESTCGGECGGGYLIFIENRNRVWYIIERKLLWVS